MLSSQKHPTTWHFTPPAAAEPIVNFAAGASIYVANVSTYDAHRSMLYALGAKSVSNKKLAHVDTIVYGAAAPPKDARTKYPAAPAFSARTLLALFHQEVTGFSDFIRALQRHGFTVRNPSDEGDPAFDPFALPLVDGSLHATLLNYLATSLFIRDYADHGDASGHRPPDPAYLEFPIPGTSLRGHILWNDSAWGRVSAQRGEGDYPLEIKGPQLLALAPAFWTESTGLYFHEYPDSESVTGLFIQAGVDVRTGLVSGAAISRVWT